MKCSIVQNWNLLFLSTKLNISKTPKKNAPRSKAPTFATEQVQIKQSFLSFKVRFTFKITNRISVIIPSIFLVLSPAIYLHTKWREDLFDGNNRRGDVLSGVVRQWSERHAVELVAQSRARQRHRTHQDHRRERQHVAVDVEYQRDTFARGRVVWMRGCE